MKTNFVSILFYLLYTNFYCQSLTITKPDERALWIIGERETIRWANHDDEVSGYNIFIGSDMNWKKIGSVDQDVTEFEWIVEAFPKANAFLKIHAYKKSLDGTQISDSAISVLPISIRFKNLHDAYYSKSSDPASHIGLGFNLGITMDLIEGPRSSDLFSELRFFSPTLRNNKNWVLNDWLDPIRNIGALLSIRQTKVFSISDQTIAMSEFLTNGNRVTHIHGELNTNRGLDIKSTVIELDLFFPIFVRQKSSTIEDLSEDIFRIDFFVHNEMYSRKVNATYKPLQSEIKFSGTVYQDLDTVLIRIEDTTGVIAANEISETYDQEFNYWLGYGLSSLLLSHGYDIHLKAGGGWSKEYDTWDLVQFLSLNIYIKELAGLAVGFRYWYNRPAEFTRNIVSVSNVGKLGYTPTTFNLKKEFEFYVVKYFSIAKFAEIFQFP